MKVNKKNNNNVNLILILVGIIVSALIVEVLILSFLNKSSSYKTSEVLLNQVSSVLEKTAKEEENLLDSLREEYITLANIVAYTMDNDPSYEMDIEKLCSLAKLMNVDEIHLFDETGTIYSGTVPMYYGLNFDSGEQIAYFKPMLENKGLSMCQDITPNTAESKNMMYAIVWNKVGNKMIQVGIESSRVSDIIKSNEVSEVTSNIPSYDGISIYVVEEGGLILGSSDKNKNGMNLSEVGIPFREVEYKEIYSETITIDGYKNYCSFKKANGYLIVVAYSSRVSLKSFVLTICIELIYLLGAAIVVYLVINKLFKAHIDRDKQFAILSSMSKIYYTMHLVDLKNNTVTAYRTNDNILSFTNPQHGADQMMREIMTNTTNIESREEVLKFTDLVTLAERMNNKKMMSLEFLGVHSIWYRCSFISIEVDENGNPTKVIYTTRCIDEEKKKEEKLIRRSNTDELTGFYNRRAYEDDITEHNDKAAEDNFVYISLDVNCLKVTNDSLGHAAGDELLVGASECMKRCFGSYGRIYRTGGDEFAAMINVEVTRLPELIQDFEDTVNSWSGNLVKSLTVSYGYVTKKEAGNVSIHQIAILADKKMYDSKSAFYREKGVDRRGQKDAHVALCALYTKILKVNITTDTYQIVNMDASEQLAEKGFSDKISTWLSNFGTTGQVHPDDLEEYLSKTNIDYMKRYFERNKTSLSIFYRRKYIDGFKQVMMEIIPANDYSSDNQSLYLYVKNIDR